MTPCISTRHRISDLNDTFRRAGPVSGGWVVTAGIQALGPDFIFQATAAVRSFDGFNAGNDPYGEHDFASFNIAGETLFWKIDAYDLDLNFGSPDPANPAVTRRVMTLMLASEY
jgi:hypothetical protein